MELLKTRVAQGIDMDIAYRYRQIPSAPTLLYVHGLGCSGEDFNGAYERPALQDFSLITFDFPGCGDSPPYPPNMHLTIDDLANVTNQVAEALDARRLILIAHSMGGAVAGRLANSQPEKVAAFINIEGNLTASDSTFTKGVAAQSREQFENHGFKQLRQEFAQSPDTGSQTYAQTLRKASPRVYQDLARSLIDHSATGELLEIFLNLNIPRLYVYGEENRADFAHYREPFAAHGIELAEIPHSRHWPLHDNPDEFYRVIGRFLKNSVRL